MGKRGRQIPKEEAEAAVGGAVHPPAKRPWALAISAFCFAAWFVFMLLAALGVL